MRAYVLAACLVTSFALPASAWAHYCPRHYHQHHHARGLEQDKYGSRRQMQTNSGSSNQDLNNQGTGPTPGSTDQGAGSSSSGTGGKRQGI